MFEAAELGRKLGKEAYRREVPRLRTALLKAQLSLRESKAFPVIVLIAGVDGAGKGETVNTLNEWMDPREIETHALGAPTDEERDRPPLWRFWRVLPPKGRLAILFGSWYTEPIRAGADALADGADLDRSVEEINRLEKMLADEGVLILKFWFHLSKRQQRKRLKELEKSPAQRRRVGDSDWPDSRGYDELRAVSEHVVRRTNKPHAHWVLVEGADARYRNVKVGKTVLQALRKRLRNPTARPARGDAVALAAGERHDGARRHRPLPDARAAGLPRAAAALPGTARPAVAPPQDAQAGRRRRVRGQRRGRQGRARSAAPRPRSTPASTASCRSRRRPRRSWRSPICGASGAACRGSGT